MKTSSPCFQLFRITVCLPCLLAGVEVGFAQQAQYAQAPQYAPTYYPPPQPSALDRIRNTGQSVGNFIRRKFYGESSTASYVQQPVYQRPPGSGQPVSYQPQRYSLDAPAQPIGVSGGTGFQQPSPGTTPKYVTPPTTTARADTNGITSPTKAVPKTKSSPPPVTTTNLAPGATTTAKKRYVPARPSTFSKPKAKPAPVQKRVEDEPPTIRPSAGTESSYDAPPKEPTTEARLNNEAHPLPGAPEPVPGEDTPGISPTIGGADVDLTPKRTSPEPVATGSSSTASSSRQPATNGATTDTGSKAAGSFLVGKKTSKPGRVVSPYAPYNELDITGLPSGSLALDPTTQKVFEVP